VSTFPNVSVSFHQPLRILFFINVRLLVATFSALNRHQDCRYLQSLQMIKIVHADGIGEQCIIICGCRWYYLQCNSLTRCKSFTWHSMRLTHRWHVRGLHLSISMNRSGDVLIAYITPLEPHSTGEEAFDILQLVESTCYGPGPAKT
jgi:hypothetical protein